MKKYLVFLALAIASCRQSETPTFYGAQFVSDEGTTDMRVAFNSDDAFMDSVFRFMESKPSGCEVRINPKDYTLTKDVLLPQVKNTVQRKKYIIDLRGAKIMGKGFTDGITNWDKMHQVNTFRSIVIKNGEFNGQDIALIVRGAQMSNFENLTFAGCRVGAKFELCLQTTISNIELNQCKDTGMYIGYSDMVGCNENNSQSNNTMVSMVRLFGKGTEIGIVFKGVSGCSATNLTCEGNGCKYFLFIDGKNSNFMKSFRAQDFHIEGEASKAIVFVRANAYSNVTLSDFYPQKGNVLVEGEGTGTIRINNIHYQPYGTWKQPHLLFKNNGTESAPLWWEFNDCIRYGGKPFKDPFYWVLQAGTSIPKPFLDGQVSSNNGDKRLKEKPHIKE